MNYLKQSALLAAALLALGMNVAGAAGGPGPRDVYTDGAQSVGARDPYTDGRGGTRDVYTDGANSMGKRDPYTDGGHQ
ncbi:hypothetical protein HI802_22215 (plasmid) [Ralstonia solanacearum]|uniref:Uncharacterized protein n=1 Tax=Ralstonia chuxiongensis TaxID=2957504 RepID=A0AA41WYV2_9RALS|nr:hypothetical protein [Ralstonia chuxiongensis]MCP1175837.1 hypothetical protein [Ralstonia chuxiongensis]QKL94783.1 hypothetical protein HI802_22215 [Ralstonia solanacearum]QKL99861.1 hypothetical protein HI801_22225 [Ralstonia solanacearum]QLR10935.1 hypothetical protein H1A20_24005 [Ralstonia solanacearum]